MPNRHCRDRVTPGSTTLQSESISSERILASPGDRHVNTAWKINQARSSRTVIQDETLDVCEQPYQETWSVFVVLKARVFESLLIKTTLRSLLYKPRCLIPIGCSIWIDYEWPGSLFNLKASVFWEHTVMRLCDDARPVHQQQKTCSQLVVKRLKIDALVADMVAWYPALEDGARFVGCSASQLLSLLAFWRLFLPWLKLLPVAENTLNLSHSYYSNLNPKTSSYKLTLKSKLNVR